VVLVGVFRKEHEVSNEGQEEFHDARGTVECPYEKPFDVDDHVLSEFGLFEALHPREAVGKVGSLVDFVVFRRIDFRNFELEFL